MGNRPNEGYAEMTVCLYLPDGRVGFMFKRPQIDGHEAHDAGGLRFEVVAPYEEHHVTYDGKVCVLANPREMADPGARVQRQPARSRAPSISGSPRSRSRRAASPSGTRARSRRPVRPQDFARGHTEQHMAITGTVQVGEQRFDVTDGFGLRDHSWGPRIWQSIWWYRWLTASFGPARLRAARSRCARTSDAPHRQRLRVRRRPLRRHDGSCPCATDAHLRLRRRVVPRSATTSSVTTDDHVYELDGDVWSNIPLRNRRDGMVTRITEGMTRWSCGDLAGAGLSEYLDQVVDDVPVGTSAGI